MTDLMMSASMKSPSSQASSGTNSENTSMTDSKKYILNRDTVAKLLKSHHSGSSSRARLLSSKKSEQRVLRGSLWTASDDKPDITPMPTPSKSRSSMILSPGKESSSAVLKIHAESLEVEDLYLLCAPGFLAEINDDECRLLLAIPNCDERYKVFLDRQRMNSGRFINVGSDVVVSRRNMMHCRAIVKWKGRLAGKQGVWFGVQIMDEENQEKGDTDGSINNIKLFECSKNNGMFVNIGHITLVPPQKPVRKAKKKTPSTPSQGSDRYTNDSHDGANDLLSQTESELSFTDNDIVSAADVTSADTGPILPDLQVNDRVVWPSDHGYEAATVKWIGELPDDALEGEILVGVEFDNQIGKGTGVYKNQRLFEAKKGHASLVPLDGLIKLNQKSTLTHMIKRQEQQTQEEDLSMTAGITSQPEPHSKITANMVLESVGIEIPEANDDKERVKGEKPYISPPGKHKESPRSRNNIEQRSPRKSNSRSRGSLDVPPIHPPITLNGSRSSCENSIGSSENMTCESSEADNNNLPDSKFPPNMDLLAITTNHCPRDKAWSDSCDSGVGHHENGFHDTKPNEAVSPQTYYKITSNTAGFHPHPPNGLLNGPKTNEPQAFTSPPQAFTSPPQAFTSPPQQLRPKTKTRLPTISSNSVPTSTPKSNLNAMKPEFSLHSDENFDTYAQPNRKPPLTSQPSAESLSSGCHEDDDLESLSNITELTESMDPLESVSPNLSLPNDNMLTELPPPPPSMHSSMSASFEEHKSFDPPEGFTEQCPDTWGIQGNSQYSNLLETILFCLSQTSLAYPVSSPERSTQYHELRTFLQNQINEPLRRRTLIRKEVMVVFRRVLNDIITGTMLKTCSLRDMQKLFRVILEHILNINPLYELNNDQAGYTITLTLNRDVRVGFPTIQQLLEKLNSNQQSKFISVPSHLIILIPRSNAASLRLFPNYHLNLTNILENSRRLCHLCGELALFECPECYQQDVSDLSAAAFCETCSQTMHRHHKRENHLPVQLKTLDSEDTLNGRTNPTLKLTHIIGVREDHFSCLTCKIVQSESEEAEEWLFFDSDHSIQVDGSSQPKVTPMTGITPWLTAAGYERMAKEIDSLPFYIDRLLTDSCVCIYTQPT